MRKTTIILRESGITSGKAKKGIDFEEAKYDQGYPKLTNAFTGLSGSDFGRKELDKPPSSTGIDFKPTKKISLPRDNQTAFSRGSTLSINQYRLISTSNNKIILIFPRPIAVLSDNLASSFSQNPKKTQHFKSGG